MDIRNAKPVHTSCAHCHGQANVLMEEWAPEREAEAAQWTCPYCQAVNAITVSGKVVGVAIWTLIQE
jgi:hypothetical protein